MAQAPELFLWDHPVSSYAQKVRIALREKKIPFKFETPKHAGTGDRTAMDANFTEGNLRMEVPMLIDGDFRVTDSTIILEYLEDKYPNPKLRPDSPRQRARARMIEEVCDSQYEAINWGLSEVKNWQRGDTASAAKLFEEAKQQVRQIHAWLTEQLGDAAWFGGERFGWADVCVWPMVNRSFIYELGPDPNLFGPLRKWYERASERDSVSSVLEEYRANTGSLKAAVEALQKGLLRREYRDHRLEWMIKSGGVDIVVEGLKKRNIRFSWPDPLE